MVAPADTIGDYCRGRCVYGQAYLPQSPADPRGRVAAGVGFGGLEDVRAFVHELGHAHGRMHAPCGDAAGVDPEYPYENAAIGVWGWDERQRQMVSPERPDFMAYCRSEWVPDYTYRALWAWITEVNGVAAPRGLGRRGPRGLAPTARYASGPARWSGSTRSTSPRQRARRRSAGSMPRARSWRAGARGSTRWPTGRSATCSSPRRPRARAGST